ncbi:MAG TPA: hypothetical protein HPP90_12350 [Deltaproteobacteria bacterium]|nr:hypothetical protein [Deltaproteobacteria bacterium]
MKRIRPLFSVVIPVILLWLTVPYAVLAETAPAGDVGLLSLKKVVLFNSGVGYFELGGDVPAGEKIHLHFSANQMNDVLKSLTVLNRSGGRISSIAYDSKKTAEQQLQDYSFQLLKDDGLPQTLRQFQGSRIRLLNGGTSITGTIVGVEKRVLLQDDGSIPEFYLTMMDDGGELQSINTDEITGIKFLDENLDKDLAHYLKIVSQGRRRDEKTVTITTAGEGRQELMVSYLVESPVWKATYRIVIPDGAKGVEPFLQGWAIVDNVSGEDWKNVRLSLVSGCPISFVQNLYAPLFRERPVIETEKKAFPAPPVPERGMRSDRMEKKLQMAAPAAANMLYAREKEEPGAGAAEPPDLEEAMRKLRAETVTRATGNLFEYSIDHPVTIDRNGSAMVPILAKTIEGIAVDLYNRQTMRENPMAAVRLKNSTGMTLEGGPVTVLQGGSYAGEALMKTVVPAETRYIAYAVDLGLHVNTVAGSTSEKVDRVVINRGMIRIHRGILETTAYNLDNRNSKPRTVVIEHPYYPDRQLLNSEKPIEITEHFLRFQVDAPAMKLTRFTVREMRDSWETVMVTNLTPDQIVVLSSRGYFSAAAMKQLEKIGAVKSRIAQIDLELEALGKERAQMFEDQKRLRENLRGLGQTTEEKALRSRYVNQLDSQETRLQGISQKHAGLMEQKEAARQQLEKGMTELEQDFRIDQ